MMNIYDTCSELVITEEMAKASTQLEKQEEGGLFSLVQIRHGLQFKKMFMELLKKAADHALQEDKPYFLFMLTNTEGCTEAYWNKDKLQYECTMKGIYKGLDEEPKEIPIGMDVFNTKEILESMDCLVRPEYYIYCPNCQSIVSDKLQVVPYIVRCTKCKKFVEVLE